MPLPANSSISLQGHSRPGEGVTTKPKIAMVVRMTEETLDALQNLSLADRMDFEFGDRPGIHIREQFFPMRYSKEKDNQELFIRTTMSARPNAPLKLNANVVGKFLVERHLSEVAVQRVRDATAAAAKQKSERKTIMIDTPPTIPTVTQKSVVKRKGPPKSTPRSTPTIVKSYATTAPSTSEPGGSTSSVTFPKETIALYHQRLIHYLALGAATQPDVVKEVGGLEVDKDVRLKITEILNEVAEQEQVARKAASASQDTKWRLKPQTWKEVRPYQYQGYTDNVRTAVARSARTWLSSLKIPENDPSWDHVKFRSNGITNANTGAGAVQRTVNGTSTATAKAKAKTKDAKMKDLDIKAKLEAVPPARPQPAPVVTLPRQNQSAEGGAASIRTGKGKEREAEKEEGEVSPSETPPRPTTVSSARRLPGSRSAGTTTPTMQPPPVPSAVQTSSQNSAGSLPRRTGPVDVRGPKRAPPEPSERARAAPPIPPPVPSDRKPVIQVKREVVGAKREREAPTATANASGAPLASTLPSREREPVKRERERERESDRESARGVKREKDRESDRESVRGRERDPERGRDREREREREIREIERAARVREKEKERDRDREKGKERERLSSSTAAKASTKRKKNADSDEDSSDWGYEERKKVKRAANASSTKIKHEREGSSSKVPTSSLKAARRESSPPRKIKRELSPLPPSKSAPSASQKGFSGLSSSMPKMKKDIKAEREREDSARPLSKQSKKRPSPTYTSSSESEEEDARPKKVKAAPKAPVAHPRVTRPLPALSKHDSLRSRYSSTYSEYLLAFQKLVSQKNKLTTMLRHGSASASGESDGDGDMLSIEELEELSARHQRLHDELESIKKSYMA